LAEFWIEFLTLTPCQAARLDITIDKPSSLACRSSPGPRLQTLLREEESSLAPSGLLSKPGD
jgi:hypothetical protein